MKNFFFYRQRDDKDCGATCLRMICNFYGINYSLERLTKYTRTTRSGTSVYNLLEASEKLGFRTLCVKIDLQMLRNEAPLPCILHWNQNHFVVLYKIKKKKSM